MQCNRSISIESRQYHMIIVIRTPYVRSKNTRVQRLLVRQSLLRSSDNGIMEPAFLWLSTSIMVVALSLLTMCFITSMLVSRPATRAQNTYITHRCFIEFTTISVFPCIGLVAIAKHIHSKKTTSAFFDHFHYRLFLFVLSSYQFVYQSDVTTQHFLFQRYNLIIPNRS